jgi:hypothetical protein
VHTLKEEVVQPPERPAHERLGERLKRRGLVHDDHGTVIA